MTRRGFLGAGTAAGIARQGSGAPEVKALTFDVFGTVVDWRSSIMRECRLMLAERGEAVDCAAFADAWRGGYAPAMAKVRSGELPWTGIDELHRMILNGLLGRFGVKGLTEPEIDHLNRAWHRLEPWPDAVAGLTRLKRKYVIATLSNGNVALLVNMAKHAGLPWDAVLSSELARHYKPDREVYLTAAQLLGLQPRECMMVAAHKSDLRAAAGVGFRTAFVPRPMEFGPGGKAEMEPDPDFDVVAADFMELARRLGA
jgi:2-haloacid dehalogenase